MPVFDYKARRTDGTVTTGELEAADRRQATQRLAQQKLQPLSLGVREPAESGGIKRVLGQLKKRRANSEDEAGEDQTASGGRTGREAAGLAFLQRLLELHSSGLPIGDSIRILGQRLSDPEQKQLATAIWRDLSEGSTLAAAMARRPRFFSTSISYVIEAGEATGQLAPILKKVIDYLEERQAIRKRMLSSMAYPAFICSIAIGVVVLFLTVLLPEIQGMLDKLGGEMTWSARLLINGSDLLVKVGPFVLVALVILAIAFTQWRRTEKGRRMSDQWLLRVPLIGKIFYYADLFQSGNLVSTLLECGINTTETLRLTERAIKNTELRERFRVARNQVNEGLSVAQALKRNDYLPDLSVDILTVGENTGNLAHSMNEITRGFREELTKRLGLLTNIVSSGALIAAFLLVTLIAIGIVTSVFQVSRTLSV